MKIHQKSLGKGQQDSFWYDGVVATTENYSLEAMGDIEIVVNGVTYQDDGARLFAGSKRWTDKELDRNVEWQHNNWFEILRGKRINGTLMLHGGEGEIYHDYDEAMRELKRLERAGD